MTATYTSKAKNQCTIYRKRPALFRRRKYKVNFVRRTAFVPSLKNPSSTKFVHFPQVQRFLDKNGKSRICCMVVSCWSFCHVSMFSLSRSSRGSSTVIFGNFWSPCTKWAKRFFGFLCLAVADENGHDLFFFSKAFQPILQHKLRDKITPLYFVICFVTSWHTKLLQIDRTCQRVIKTINVK